MRSAAAILLGLVLTAAARAQCVGHAFNGPPAPALSGVVLGSADFDGDRRRDILTSDDQIRFGNGRVMALPKSGARFITDVNRDGRPDIVGFGDGELWSLINNGDVTFTAVTTHTVKPSTPAPKVLQADFNGDGLLDVFVTGLFDPFFQSTPLFLAKGDGTFTAEYSIGSAPQVSIGDFNGDGRDDFIVADAAGNTTMYLRAQNGFALPQKGPRLNGSLVSAADFDGDRRADLLVNVGFGNTTYAQVVFDPAGSPYLGTSIPGSAVLAPDLNGDGKADMLSLISSTNLQVYLNDGHGNMRAVSALPGYFDVSGAADINGDGVVDLITTTGVALGNGDGTFRVPFAALPAADSAAAGDFDGDGDDDIALPTAIAWNNGDNSFRVGPINDPRLQHPLVAADFDGDGKAELITRSGNAVFVLSPRPDGSIVELRNIGVRAVGAAVGDFTGAHHLELAVLADTLHQVQIYDVATGAARVVLHTQDEARTIAAADLNVDGKDDIVAGGGELITTATLDNPSGYPTPGFISTFLSTGSSFGSEHLMTVPNVGFTSFVLSELVTGDFDGDGKIDAAAVDIRPTFFVPSGQPLFIFMGDGSGTFPAFKRVMPEGDDSFNVLRVADFDGDGRADIAVNGATSILFGTAAGPQRREAYFGPRNPVPRATAYAPVVVRAHRGALPWILVPTPFADAAYLYRPTCQRPRTVQH